MALLSEDLETAMSGHGIDVCACGAVLRSCRCMGPHVPRVVAQSCPSCARTEAAESDDDVDPASQVGRLKAAVLAAGYYFDGVGRYGPAATWAIAEKKSGHHYSLVAGTATPVKAPDKVRNIKWHPGLAKGHLPEEAVEEAKRLELVLKPLGIKGFEVPR